MLLRGIRYSQAINQASLVWGGQEEEADTQGFYEPRDKCERRFHGELWFVIDVSLSLLPPGFYGSIN